MQQKTGFNVVIVSVQFPLCNFCLDIAAKVEQLVLNVVIVCLIEFRIVKFFSVAPNAGSCRAKILATNWPVDCDVAKSSEHSRKICSMKTFVEMAICEA